MNRRGHLAVVGTVVASIAGCTDESNNGSESDPSPTETEELEPAEFVFTGIIPGDYTVELGESVELGATFENVGDKPGTREVSVAFGNEFENSMDYSLDPGEEGGVTQGLNTEPLEAGDYEYTFTTGDDEISAILTVEIAERIFDMGESILVEEETLEIAVLDSRRTPAIGSGYSTKEANGIYEIVTIEAKNVGNEEIQIGHSDFKLVDAQDVRYEADSGAAIYQEDGISGIWEDLNPGVSTTLEIAFDVPEDRDIPYFMIEGGGGLITPPGEYLVRLD